MPCHRTPVSGCLVVGGGEERTDSVVAGITALTAAGVADETPVLVHDAARPAASPELMVRVVSTVRAGTGAVPVVPVADSLKTVRCGACGDRGGRPRNGRSPPRRRRAPRLGPAARRHGGDARRGRSATDEAAAMASGGIGVRAVEGEPINRKLTDPGDEAMLRAALGGWSVPLSAPAAGAGLSAGIGFDAHRLEDGRALHLGGLDCFPGSHGPGRAIRTATPRCMRSSTRCWARRGWATSGAVSAGRRAWRDADSGELLRQQSRTFARAGWRPVGVDLAIVAAAARDRAAPRRDGEAHRRAARPSGRRP